MSIVNVSIMSNEDKQLNVIYFIHYILQFHVYQQPQRTKSLACWKQLNSNRTNLWLR